MTFCCGLILQIVLFLLVLSTPVIIVSAIYGFIITFKNLVVEYFNKFKSNDVNQHIVSQKVTSKLKVWGLIKENQKDLNDKANSVLQSLGVISENERVFGNNEDPAMERYLSLGGRWSDDLINACKKVYDNNLDSAKSNKNTIVKLAGEFSAKDNTLTALSRFLQIVGIIGYSVALILGTFIWAPFLFLFFFSITSIYCLTYFLLASLFKSIELLYFHICGVFSLCKFCHAKVGLPVYECPNCHVKHYNLLPSSKYGMFYRRCTCGQKIPCLPLTGRNKLTAFCRSCGASTSTEHYVPLTIAFLGGPSAGKTMLYYSMMAKALKPVIENYNWKINYAEDANSRIAEMENHINNGIFPAPTQDEDIKAFCVDVEREKRQYPLRLFFYDPPGKSFQNSSKLREHRYFEHLKCVVWVVDPFCFDTVRNNYYDQPELFASSKDTMSPEGVFDRWLIGQETYFSNILKNSICAIVITKTDVPFVSQKLGIQTKDIDYNCRKFIENYGSSNFVVKLEKTFSKIKFFAVSSTGGAPEGSLFFPRGVDDVAKWLFDNLVE